ncbi:MAG TPA: hypothetical protein VFM99_05340 [Chitinophagales bacterium]|nr:hypothetical protein [Chitinophagales bacterium]
MNIKRYIQTSILIILLYAIVFCISGYTVNQGFNPSDEGVVLSQSWRLLNHEVPHKEFISIRPVGSGLLHQVDLILPFPIIPTSRIIAALEYILISILWVFIFLSAVKKYIPDNKQYLIYSTAIISTIILNLNNGPIFTWTTTDALLFDTIAFYFLMRFLESTINNKMYYKYAIPSIFFASCATLCRQSFALPLVLLGIVILVYNFQLKKFPFRILIGIIGSTPLLLYFIYLWQQDALQLFIDQMTGRTELVDTGIITYSKSLAKYPWIIIQAIGLLFIFFRKSILQNSNKISSIINLYYLAITLTTLWFTMHLFFGNYTNEYSFYFYWLLVILLMHGIFIWRLHASILIATGLTILIAWTSSISIGDNSPRPYLGGIAIACWILIFIRLSNINYIQIHLCKAYSIIAVATILLFIISQLSMPKVNYRDWTSAKLNYTLDDIFPEMGKTKVNDNTRKYFVEFNRIYTLLNQPKNHFTMIPNNAFIYSVMHSKNPLPLDWMQHHEYIGAEEQFMEMVTQDLQETAVYLFVDKIDSKLFYKGIIPFEPDLEFNHSYIPWLTSQCEKLPIASDYFEIYKSKN